jgi:hypothetical protein
MTTFTKCYSPIKGRVLRVTLLDECGVPVTGTGSAVVVSGFVQVQSSPQYETGDEFLKRDANGDLCINEKDPDILKRFELTVDLCAINPGLVANTISPARLLTYSEAPTGTGFAMAEGAATTHFSLEVWQRVTGSAACDAAGNQQYVYNAWPHLTNGKVGDYNIANEPSTLQLIAESKAVSTRWDLGLEWLGAGAVSVVPDHWFQNLTTVAPPAASCVVADNT